MTYPGDLECRLKPDCNLDYDALKKYKNCKDGKREVEYKWRENIICNYLYSNLPFNFETECETCSPGFFLKNPQIPLCERCPEGSFTNVSNAAVCIKCPAGKYAPKVIRYENFEKFPEDFNTKCELIRISQVNLCAFSTGWIVAKKSLTVMSSTPAGVRLILEKMINIKQNQGLLEIKYKANQAIQGVNAFEVLKLGIDGSYETYFIMLIYINRASTK